MDRPAFSYRFGSAEFDESRFELRVGGLPVEVEHRALEVLAYLLRHAGEVVTKEELLREVWSGRITVDKVLPNAVNKLRRALGEANAGLIYTQARIGYRLDGVVTRTAVGRQPGSRLALTAGQTAPGRPNFVLMQQLGRSAGSEVWLAEHPKTHETRVYKFALDVDRLRALKREVTLLRVLQEGAPDDADRFVEVIDWNFEAAPYFLECKHGGEPLHEWAATRLADMDTSARLSLFLQMVDAMAVAHSLGVLHKDLKPANVLVSGDARAPHVRITDFGSGHLLDPDRLEQLGITRLGMTVEDRAWTDSTSGTPLYIAPELFIGQSPTVKSDVFALGILLYQLVTARIGQPMVSGWESDVSDDMLREDLQLATDGNPLRRLSSAAELADRLRRLEARRANALQLAAEREASRRDREAWARTQARRPYVHAVIGMLVLGVAAIAWLLHLAVDARNQARVELGRATALARFLNEDLIGRSNPLVSVKGPDATLREVLLSMRERVHARFDAQPLTEAAIHGSLASLFSAVDLFEDAENEARRSLELLEQHGDIASTTAFEARAVLVRVLSRRGKVALAQEQLDALEQLAARMSTPLAQVQLAATRSLLNIARGDNARAATDLRTAIDGLHASEPGNTAFRDALRLDLIALIALDGENAEAREESRRFVDEIQGRQGDHALLLALTRVAAARAQGEDHDAARAMLEAARPVIAERLGESHSRYITLLNELFAIAFRKGDWPLAIGYAQSVHERMRAKFGNDHVLTYVTLGNWGRVLNEAGRPADALEKLSVAHAELVRVVGPTSPRTQDVMYLVAMAHTQLGHTARAQAVIDQLDAKVLESGRATGVWDAGIDALRGMVAMQRGENDTARRLLDGALDALKGEEELSPQSRLYTLTKQARARLR